MATRNELNTSDLFSVCRGIQKELRQRGPGRPVRLKSVMYYYQTDTSGWFVEIGNLGRSQPKIEIWLDRFSGHLTRKFAAVFSGNKLAIQSLIKHADKALFPVRKIKSSDLAITTFRFLDKKLISAEFSHPVYEIYKDDHHYFGIYDRSRGIKANIREQFIQRAASFFEDVSRAFARNELGDQNTEVYPKTENRRLVTMHLRRERSRYLANECKIRDKFICQVCMKSLKSRYGLIGERFAEAHHIVPLGKLKKQVKSELKDLITVCPNCHRILHLMEGKTNDIATLKALAKRHKA